MNKFKFWLNNARNISLPQSLLPAFTAVAVAAASASFGWVAAILCVIGVAFAHLGLNLADDYFDYQVGSGEARKKHASEGVRARMVKYPYLTDGSATVKELAAASCIFLLIAVACGVGVALLSGWKVLWFALAGAVVGYTYSGAPFRLGFRYLGELIIFLMFGPLLMTGIYFACTGALSYEIILISIAVGFLVTNIVYSHSIMDAEHDIKAGKRTMAHLMGSRRGQIVLSAFFNIAPSILMIAGVACGILHWGYLFTLVTLPMSIWLVGSLNDFVCGKDVELMPKRWMGPMGNWEAYQKAGMDWFLLRWLLARNIDTFFCLIIIIVNIVLAIVK